MLSTVTKIRIRYADTDQMKMVYHAKYLEYFEQGRSDLLREIGLPYSEIERMGYYLPVLEAHAKYLKPARYDNLISVITTIHEMPLARIRIDYKITLEDEKDNFVEGYTIHGFVSAATGKPARAPEHFLEALSQALHSRKKK
jgi:acyl-CoA thioester hydrolase